MERLLRPHREAVNQRDPLDTEDLLQQPLLNPDIVGHREMWITAAVKWRQRVTWRRRQAVAELIDDHDEIFARVQRLLRCDRPFEIVMLRPVRGWIDDD